MHIFYVSIIYNKHELKTVQLLGNFNFHKLKPRRQCTEKSIHLNSHDVRK